KPRFNPAGQPEPYTLVDPGPPPWTDRFALTRLLSRLGRPVETWSPDGEMRLPMEWVAYFRDDPTPMPEVKKRTRGALSFLKKRCDEIGAGLLVVPIPNKACVEPDAMERLREALRPSWLARVLLHRRELDPGAWSPDVPVETF